MTLTLLGRSAGPEGAPNAEPAIRELEALLAAMHEAIHAGMPPWVAYPPFAEYAAASRSLLRSLEYRFVVEAVAVLEAAAKRPLRILQTRCGVAPLCNWLSRRGHEVVAIDPSSANIEFLLSNNLNEFYDSQVQYHTACCELLPFDAASFDVVLAISALGQLLPGNDRVALWEMGRVLKPGGHLVITARLAPPGDGVIGALADPPPDPRSLSVASVRRWLEAAAPLFTVGPTDLPMELDTWTRDDVQSFWATIPTSNSRREPPPHQLALAGVLGRTEEPVVVSIAELVTALGAGQAALEHSLGLSTAKAERDNQLIQQLATQVASLIAELQALATRTEEAESRATVCLQVIHRRDKAVAVYSAAAEERLALVQELKRVVDERLHTIEELQARLHMLEATAEERLRLIEQQKRTYLQATSQLDATLAHQTERLDALTAELSQMAVIYQEATQNAEARAAQAEAALSRRLAEAEAAAEARAAQEEAALSRRLAEAEAAAEARLQVIEEQERALTAFRRAHWKEWLKQSVRPRLGVLYQYSPRPLDIRIHYRRTRPLLAPPLISIVTPTYNQGPFIERTIQSVLEQDYPRLEYIIQDGASTDETQDILQRYENSLAHVESREDTGFVNAINLGFRWATGEIMAYLNSDDLLLPGTLHYVAQYFVEHSDVDVVYGHRVIIDEYDAEVGRWVLPPHDAEILSWADYVPQETLFWRRRAWDKIGGTMDESFRFAADWDLLVRLRDANATFMRLPRFLGAFRLHPHQKTSTQIADLGNQEMDRIRQRSLGRTVTHHEIWRALRSYMRRHVIYHRLYRLGVLRY